MSATRCTMMLCHDDAVGLVRFRAIRADVGTGIEAPMCQPCSDVLADGLERQVIPHVTPGGAVYLGNLDWLLRKPA